MDEVKKMNEQANTPTTLLIGVLGVIILSAHVDSGAGMAVPEARVIGGSATAEGDWSFMAYIYERKAGVLNRFICGGSLINNRWVLSATHCFQTPNRNLYRVRLGEYSRSVTSPNEQDFGVSKLVLHASFDPVAFVFDIALIKLSGAATINQYVSPVNLVDAGRCTDPTPNFPVDACYTLGWGNTAAGNTSNTLRKVTSYILPHRLCKSHTEQHVAKYGNRPVLYKCEAKFCGGYNRYEDTCQGDSGGPLVCRHSDNQYYVHGILSYGTKPCGFGLPGIYTSVAVCRGWISRMMTP